MVAQLDRALFIALNTWTTNPAVDRFFVTITTPSNWIVPLVICALLSLFTLARNSSGVFRPALRPSWKRNLAVLVLAGVVVGLSDPLCYRVLKPLFGRLRPCHPDHLIDGARYLLGYKRSLSMPSIHASNMLGAATLLTWFYPRRWWWFLVPAALVGYSRVYVGVHWPGDVLVGGLVGAVIASTVYWGWRWATRRNADWLRSDAGGPGCVGRG